MSTHRLHNITHMWILLLLEISCIYWLNKPKVALNTGFLFQILPHSFGERSDFSPKLWEKIWNRKLGSRLDLILLAIIAQFEVIIDWHWSLAHSIFPWKHVQHKCFVLELGQHVYWYTGIVCRLLAWAVSRCYILILAKVMDKTHTNLERMYSTRENGVHSDFIACSCSDVCLWIVDS